MEIPEKIKINGINWKVEIVKDVSDDLNEAKYRGKVCFKEDKIKILNSYTDADKFRTLLHEIIHILDDDYKLNLEEDAIKRITSSLHQVLKDNNLLKD